MTATILDTSCGEASLSALPVELLELVCDFLPSAGLRSLCLVNHRIRDVANSKLWENVALLDCKTRHDVTHKDYATFWGEGHNPSTLWGLPDETITPLYGVDMHDDTPIIKKLLVLASNPLIASKVQILTHRCHLPTPAIFHEMQHQSYYGATLSSDPRIWDLLRLAIKNMTNVHTLRIINGHYFLTAILLRGFFSVKRKAKRRITRLWLESCAIDSLLYPSFRQGYAQHKHREFDMTGLQTLRVRRTRMDKNEALWTHARGGLPTNFHNGKGGLYPTTVYAAQYAGNPDYLFKPALLKPSREAARSSWTKFRLLEFYNHAIFHNLPEVDRFLSGIDGLPDDEVCDKFLDDDSFEVDEEAVVALAENVPPFPTYTLVRILGPVSSTLTSLNLDWILMNKGDDQNPLFLCEYLSKLRFPHLRAFQFRNTNSVDTEFPAPVYLLHPYVSEEQPEDNPHWDIDFLGFLEAHPSLECLGWSLDRFYTHERVDHEEAERARAVVMELGRSLTSLRLDAEYAAQKDVLTDDSTEPSSKQERIRRRKFISQFAAHMTKLKTFKVEGGVPRDERREMLRALHRCPLEHLVFISLTYPIGHSLVLEEAEAMQAADDLNTDTTSPTETPEAMPEVATFALPTIGADFEFHPKYGWGDSRPLTPPLVHTIATFFADTITELKFCGPNGGPTLHRPSRITAALLHHLRHFHNLRHLVTSFFLQTFFDFDWREPEIIKYWLDTQPGGTALVAVDPAPATEQEDRMGIGEQDEGDVDNTGPENPETHVGEPPAGNDDNEAGPTPSAAPVVEVINDDQADGDNADGAGYDDTANDAATTAPPIPTPEVNPWEVTLRRQFSPPAMAQGVYELLAPHLSPIAKARRNSSGKKVGVYVRASYCIGVEQENIFDFETWVGEEGPLLWRGPKAEADLDRYWEKLDSRLWF